MAKRFHSILVPVDFSENTDTALSTALSIPHCGSCIIHLLHVQQAGAPDILEYFKRLWQGYSWRQLQSGIRDSEIRLSQLKQAIETKRKDIKVYTSVSYGDSVEGTISKMALNLGADLVILGKHSHHNSFPGLNTVTPSSIALITGIPVLTAKPGSRYNAVRKIVMPVGLNFPVSKLAMLEALQSDPGMQIILVVFPFDETFHSFSKQTLLNTFRALKNQSSNPVKYEVLQGKNKTKALLNYCKSIEADMLIVHAGAETRVNAWRNSHISDLLPASSRMQILAVKAL